MHSYKSWEVDRIEEDKTSEGLATWYVCPYGGRNLQPHQKFKVKREKETAFHGVSVGEEAKRTSAEISTRYSPRLPSMSRWTNIVTSRTYT